MPKVPAGVPSDVLSRRPDVMEAEQNLIAANANIGVAKSQYFPTISITSALGLASDDLQWLLARTARTGDFTRGFVGTLFSAGRIEGDVREAEALHQQMAERYLQAVQSGLQEVDDALIYRNKAGEQEVAVSDRVKTLQDVTRLSRLRYEGGMATYLDVLDAERRVYAAQTQQSQSQRDEMLALVSVYKAMGGGWMVEQNKTRETKVAALAAAAASAAASTAAPQDKQAP
jgi:multidrug efflux system outer membrane protein